MVFNAPAGQVQNDMLLSYSDVLQHREVSARIGDPDGKSVGVLLRGSYLRSSLQGIPNPQSRLLIKGPLPSVAKYQPFHTKMGI